MTILTRPTSERATAKAPLGDSTRRRQTFRRVVGEPGSHILGQLDQCLSRTVLDVVANPSGSLTILVPGYQLHLADVCAVAQHRMLSVCDGPCQLTAGGQYGRFWWLTITRPAAGGSPTSATALGSRLSIFAHTSDRNDGHPEPEPHTKAEEAR